MAETVSDVAPRGTGSVADLIAAAAALSNQERAERLDLLFRVKAATEGEILVHLGETDRRQAYRDDGATSLESWTVERFGLSTPTARAYAHVAGRAWDLPHLVGALCEGDITFDKLRAVISVASPETDRELRDQAQACTVRELADIARSTARTSAPPARSVHDRRFLRFNDQFRTMSVQLPPESYAETRACIDALARAVPSDGETPLDQRRCDALMAMIHSTVPGGSGPGTTASPFVVVVHAPLEALVDDSGEESALAGELERDGLIDGETVRRIACDATIAVAVDDDVGHTMYEGRARRFPSEASAERSCGGTDIVASRAVPT